MADVISSRHRCSMADVLERHLSQTLPAEYRQVVAEMAAEAAAELGGGA